MSENPPTDPTGAAGSGDNKPTTEPRGRSAGGRSKSHKVGDVIKVGDGYGLVVGYEDVTHHGENNDGSAKVEKKSHPLVVDLPAPRRVETETEAAS